MKYKSKRSPGYSSLLIRNLEEVYDDIRCMNSIVPVAERNVGCVRECLGRVRADLSRLRRAVGRLCKAKPLWFSENGCGIVDKKMPELNARTKAFFFNVASPIPVFEEDHFINMVDEADALVVLMRRVRRRVRKKTRAFLVKKRKE